MGRVQDRVQELEFSKEVDFTCFTYESLLSRRKWAEKFFPFTGFSSQFFFYKFRAYI